MMKGYRLNPTTHHLEPIPGYQAMLARRCLKAGVQLQRRGMLFYWLSDIVQDHRLGELFARLGAERRAIERIVGDEYEQRKAAAISEFNGDKREPR